MGDFIIFSVLLQAITGLCRERAPRLDGLWVNAVAVVIGCVMAFAVPEARVADAITGMAMREVTNIIASGCMMALGAKFLADIQKSMATARVRSVADDSPAG